MKKIKTSIIIILVILIIIGIVIGINKYFSWPVRFNSEFNDFFGEGNWKTISEETKKSIIYTKYYSSRNLYGKEVPGKFKNWYIEFNNDKENIVWKITNHTYKINNDRNFIFSSDRLSAKQALGREFMDISFQIIGEDIKNNYLSTLSTNEIDCLRVELSYDNGNPKPKFYSDLFKEDWFNVEEIKAINYLNIDPNKFYIDIFTYDYKLEKLSEEEKSNLYNVLVDTEKKLLEDYQDKASFRIFFNDEYDVEYEKGAKQ